MNCIIVDDEPLAREGMLLNLQNIAGVNIVGAFNSVRKAEEFMKNNQVDLIFLDVQMPGKNGLKFAAGLPKEVMVIFVTAYSQYALESYNTDAIDYLVKPVRQERLERAVKKAFTFHNLLDRKGTTEDVGIDFILIKANRRYHKIFFRNILYIQGLKDYVIIYTEQDKIITAMNLKTVYGYLDEQIFCRVSKSYLVNLRFISSFDSYTIYIKDTEIPIGNVYRQAFLEQYLGKNLSDQI